MTIVRIHTKGGLKDLWDRLVKKWCGKTFLDGEVIPLYASRQFIHTDMSLILKVPNREACTQFILDEIAPIEEVESIWTITLEEPLFLPVPPDHNGLRRYTVTIKVRPQRYRDVYDTVKECMPTDEIVVTYIAYIFQSFGDDIIISVLGKDISTVERFILERIRAIDGVIDTEISPISATKRLVSKEDWMHHLGEYLMVPECAKLDDLSRPRIYTPARRMYFETIDAGLE